MRMQINASAQQETVLNIYFYLLIFCLILHICGVIYLQFTPTVYFL